MGKLLGIRLGSSVRHMSAFSMLYGGICSSFMNLISSLPRVFEKVSRPLKSHSNLGGWGHIHVYIWTPTPIT